MVTKACPTLVMIKPSQLLTHTLLWTFYLEYSSFPPSVPLTQHSLGLHILSLQVSTSMLSHPLSLDPTPNTLVQVTYLEYLVPSHQGTFNSIL